MSQQTKIEKLKFLLNSVLKEVLQDNQFEQIKIKTKQSLQSLAEIEKKIDKKNKKNQQTKDKKLQSNSAKNLLRMLDDQINQQQDILDKIENNKQDQEQTKNETLFD